MKSAATLCDYCGEPSKWGYYRFDGGHVCDDCGDFLLHAVGSHGGLQTVVIADRDHECPQELLGHPALLRKMDRPLEDLLVSITPGKHDIVIPDARNQDNGVTINPAKPRKLFSVCNAICDIILHHMRLVFGVKNSLPNVKEHAPSLATPSAETGGDS
jgi:hypothetical protein